MLQTINRKKLYQPYVIMLAVYFLFIIVALCHDTPLGIYYGLKRIVTSRSVLLTDYIYVGGIGATLINSALVGGLSIVILIISKVKPNGSIIMALWLTAGFAFFGKNIFNMMPITFGVYLYSKYRKEPFVNYSLVALLSATLSPVVSGICFSDILTPVWRFLLGITLGVAVGFIFPVISAFTNRVHDGYNLYNMGLAGGLISMFLVAAFQGFGINFEANMHWSSGNNFVLSILLYTISFGLIICGLAWGGGIGAIQNYPNLLRLSGRLVSDFYAVFGRQIYFNMGLAGALATTIMIITGCDLNGPTIGGIFTIIGFSAFGKHLRNIFPTILGAILATRLNMWEPSTPLNTVAVLFSTGLSPIAGQFGWGWGIVAGFLHVTTVLHITFLNCGFNLYNNGFAAGFVVLVLLPIINAFHRVREK